ncbi:glycerate kinase type-2 family protein [Pigmentiphaga litoralis]|uniref:glycerate kinase type-2 family protein n=1 Tax=Pigmentiphaga litoralis TaxID=516702 RepID=UPI003B430723
MTPQRPRDVLNALFEAAVQAASPAGTLAAHLPERPAGRTVVIGAGKAAASMAQALEAAWDGELSGVVVTRYGHALPLSRIRVIEASHPVPDAAGLEATAQVMDAVRGLTEDDLVICLISGGGSALLCQPLPGIDAEDKRDINRQLLHSGASISEMNCVRRHLSAVKGGRLAAACLPARVHTLLISDVPGDDPVDIASGPTLGDPTTCRDALAIIDRYGLRVADRVLSLLKDGRAESIKPGDPRLARATGSMLATPYTALSAAADAARRAGITPYLLGDRWEGDATEVGKAMAGLVLHTVRDEGPFTLPCVLLSGGETTVTVTGSGRGGRNVQFLLSLMLALGEQPQVHAIAADTDGVDGVEPIAGACIDPTSLARTRALRPLPRAWLDNNDAHSLFSTLGDTVVTGPTLSNVNDFRAIYIARPGLASLGV